MLDDEPQKPQFNGSAKLDAQMAKITQLEAQNYELTDNFPTDTQNLEDQLSIVSEENAWLKAKILKLSGSNRPPNRHNSSLKSIKEVHESERENSEEEVKPQQTQQPDQSDEGENFVETQAAVKEIVQEHESKLNARSVQKVEETRLKIESMEKMDHLERASQPTETAKSPVKAQSPSKAEFLVSQMPLVNVESLNSAEESLIGTETPGTVESQKEAESPKEAQSLQRAQSPSRIASAEAAESQKRTVSPQRAEPSAKAESPLRAEASQIVESPQMA